MEMAYENAVLIGSAFLPRIFMKHFIAGASITTKKQALLDI